MGSTSFRFLIGVAVGTAAIAAATGVAEAKPRKAKIPASLYRKPLVLTSFVQNGRLDVQRNEFLVFKFSAVVRAKSVDNRSIRVLQQTGSGTKAATGALMTQANVVRFDPSRTQRNYDDSRRRDVEERPTSTDNPSGFLSFTDFLIQIPGPPELHTVQNHRGDRILQGFSGSFRTNGTYADPVPGQPFFVGQARTGNLGFEPPRSAATGLVDEDAVILLEFNEPINIDTLDPSSTVIVTRVAVNEQVPGFIRMDPNDRSGKKFQFVPSLGFGSDLANQQGWDISVTLTEGITDLAGNPLKRPFTAPRFTTRYVPGKKSASVVTETFATQTKMDPVSLTDGGEWNTIERGALRGGAATAFPVQKYSLWEQGPGPGSSLTPVYFRTNDPLVTDQTSASQPLPRPFGSRVQMMYIPSDVGAAGAITAIGWGPSSNALFGAEYPEVTVQVGHTSSTALVADFASNVNVGSPVQVYKGVYTVPQKKNIDPTDPTTDPTGVTRDPDSATNPGRPRGYWLWPNFTTPFEWNGVNNLVFDAAVQSGPQCQILRCTFIPAGQSFPTRRAVATSYTAPSADFVVEQSVYDIQFNKRRRTTRATSLWYELASDNPQFGQPIQSPIAQPGGVSVLVELEAAHGKPDPLNPGGFIPNTATATGFTTDITQIDGHRFFRFRVTMVANLNSNQTARLASVAFPYQF